MCRVRHFLPIAWVVRGKIDHRPSQFSLAMCGQIRLISKVPRHFRSFAGVVACPPHQSEPRETQTVFIPAAAAPSISASALSPMKRMLFRVVPGETDDAANSNIALSGFLNPVIDETNIELVSRSSPHCPDHLCLQRAAVSIDAPGSVGIDPLASIRMNS